MSSRPWSSCMRVWLSSIASMSSWVPWSMRTRVPAIETSLRALGSVHSASPEVSGVLATAGAQSVWSRSWKDTAPCTKASRPTRAGGSPDGWACVVPARPTTPANNMATLRRKSSTMDGLLIPSAGTINAGAGCPVPERGGANECHRFEPHDSHRREPVHPPQREGRRSQFHRCELLADHPLSGGAGARALSQERADRGSLADLFRQHRDGALAAEDRAGH